MAAGDTPDLLSNQRQGPFAASPVALRTIFQITGEKAYPQFQAGFVQPSIDVSRLTIDAQLSSIIGGNALVTGIGLFNSGGFVVPQGTAWLLESVVANCQTTGAENIRFKLVAEGVQGSAPIILTEDATSSLTDAVGASLVIAGRHFDAGYVWLPPGTQVGVWAERVTTAGTIAVAVSGRFLPIRL